MPPTAAASAPLRHLSIRVPWHDAGWADTVCTGPTANTACLVLKGIGEGRADAAEEKVRGQALNVLSEEHWPCCAGERGFFMAPFELTRTKTHPYAEWSKQHAHFRPTPLRHPAYAADVVPFRWMFKPERWTNAKKPNEPDFRDGFGVTLDEAREPVLDMKSDNWMQQRDNHLAALDTFFAPVREDQSLCFFYAKRTPLSDDPRRVIVGVGRVKKVLPTEEYKYSVLAADDPRRSMLWERMVQHTEVLTI